VSGCKIERRMLVTHGTLNMVTGLTTQGRKEWETRACGAPLFVASERKLGVCNSCFNGWAGPENHPTADGWDQVAAARIAAATIETVEPEKQRAEPRKRPAL